MERSLENVVIVLCACLAATCLLLNIGGVVGPAMALFAVAVLAARVQRKHNAERRAAIAEFREGRTNLTDDVRERRLLLIEARYGTTHRAVRELVAEERAASRISCDRGAPS
jgi:hypothetical protein